MDRIIANAGRTAGAFSLLIVLAAAGPAKMPVQIGDVEPFAQTATLPSQAPSFRPAQALTFQSTIFQAAPVPDPDVQAPPGAVNTEAQVGPRFLSAPSLFQGDGYAYASSQQGTLDRRKTVAAGLGLSVPVDQ
jgi:hypothetical protein